MRQQSHVALQHGHGASPATHASTREEVNLLGTNPRARETEMVLPCTNATCGEGNSVNCCGAKWRYSYGRYPP
jgi:hypothetical protein